MDNWITDFAEAKDRALNENKRVLMLFCGSDWCGWCKRLDKEVLTRSSFTEWANSRLVPLKLDFPKYRMVPAELAAANEALRVQYGVAGFPTVLLLDSEGQELLRTGYLPGGPERYTDHLATGL